ncbi:MAG: hypothetical protein GYB64_09805, partial [Chloroflexi bacterium]|nr:hypothetical protein [Chloroflexota bacterium]
ALPALERMLFAESVWPLAGLGVLALAGLIVQVGGVLVDVRAYSDYLFAQTGQAPWQPLALWNPRWTQPVASLRLIGRTQTNILWLIGGVRWTALAGIGLLIAGWTAFLIWQRKPRPDRPSPLAVGIGIGVLVVATPLILSTAHDDPRFLGGRADLFEALDYLEAHTAANDVIMLTSETYLPFFQNHYKGSRDWYALPTSPGERFSCEQTPPVVSDDVNAQIHEVSRAMIDSAWGSDIIFGPTRGRLWLVGDISPYGPCQTRPVMHYAALNGGIIAVAEIAPNVRLVQTVPFSVVSRTDARPLNAAFGESIQLEAFTTRQSRGFLGLTLWWHAVDAPSTDYTVGVFLLGPAGVVQQIDWQPVFGFRPTSMWEDGDTIRDNYGFDLRDVPPGDYVIGVVLYELPSVERLPVTVGGEPQPDNLLVVTGVTVEP